MGPHPAVAAIRLAVRRVLHDILTELNKTVGAPVTPRRRMVERVAAAAGVLRD